MSSYSCQTGSRVVHTSYCSYTVVQVNDVLVSVQTYKTRISEVIYDTTGWTRMILITVNVNIKTGKRFGPAPQFIVQLCNLILYVYVSYDNYIIIT
jgi:hypothetical protein